MLINIYYLFIKLCNIVEILSKEKKKNISEFEISYYFLFKLKLVQVKYLS